MNVREKPPLRVSTTVVTPSGHRYRWAGDEPEAENVPGGQRYSDTMPGGFEQYTAILPRKPGVDYADLEPLSTVTLRGAGGGGVAGEYRLEAIPSTSGDQMAVSPAAVGWQAALDDNKTATMVYRDTDLSRWRDMSTARRLALASTNVTIGSIGVVSSPSGSPALVLSQQGSFVSASGFRSNALYSAPSGNDVARVYFAWASNAAIGTGAGNWEFFAFSTNDEATFSDASSDQLTGGASSGTLTYTPATARQMVLLQMGYTIAGGADGTDYEVHLTNVAVYGNHGLTIRGTEPTAGFYASDIVTHAVRTWVPSLQIRESVQQSGFVVPHLAFLEPTTPSEIIRQASRFSLPDWGVWEDRVFWYTQRGGRARRWRARIGPSQLEETGPQLDRVWNSVVVAYQDVDGTTRTVGPPSSGTDSESSLLVDSDPDNPANRLGITRRDVLSIGVSTAAGAIAVGSQFLAEARQLDRSGKASAVGHIEDDRGVLHPYWAPRAGDEVAFVDAADKSYRRVVRTDKDHDTRTVTFDLDAPPEGLQQLLERLGVVLVPLGL